MNTQPASAELPRTIWSEFEGWAAPFKPWQRFVLSTIIRSVALTDDQVGAAYSQYLYDHELGPAPQPALDIPVALAGRPATALRGTTYLKALSNLRGANALPATAALVFSPGLTVIYGGNGVGKSGFARVLSSACFCRNRPTVIPDIYANGPQPSLAATVNISGSDGNDFAIELTAGVEIPDLKRISVFDTIEARTYLTEQNPLGFKPIGFDVFPEMARVYAKLLERLDGEISQRIKLNIFPNSFIAPQSDLSLFVAGLNAKTKIEDINRLANFGEAETARLTEVSRQITELQTRSVETALDQLESAKSDLQTTLTQLAAALAYAAPEARARDQGLIETYREHASAVTAMGSDSFKQSFFKATGSPEWEGLLTSAHALAAHEDASYPKPGDHCLFCNQPLDETSHALIHRYWEFLASDVRQRAAASKEAVDAAVDDLETAYFDFFNPETTAFATVTRLRPELAPRIENVITMAATYCDRTIAKLKGDGADLSPPEWADVFPELASLLVQIETDIARLKGNNPAESIKKLDEERVLLRHRQVLHQLYAEIMAWIRDQKWAALAADTRKFLSPRPITDKEKELFETVIAEGYRSLLAQECESLNCEVPIEMHTQGQRGQTIRSLKMKGYKPDQILSEGEQRAVALADFLTEVTLNPSATGIILDDPVNSQDHQRKRLIAARLVKEAERRQVIVFTHDMVFLSRLVELAGDGVSPMTHWIERDHNGRPGQVTLHDSPAESKQYRKVDKAVATLAEANAATGSDRHRLVQRGMGELRRMLEEIVPWFMFQQVVNRWSDRVIVTRLKKVNWDNALADEIVAAYEELSSYIEGHTHPEESSGAPPDPATLGKLIKRVGDIVRRAKIER